MARIRTIKPEYWQDEKIGKLSMPARLLFIGMWNFSDDAGVVRGNPVFLRSQIFPYDDITKEQMESWLSEIENQQLIITFVANDESFYEIKNFLKHQLINRPSKNKNPKRVKNDEQSLMKNKTLTESSVSTQTRLNDGSLTEREYIKGIHINPPPPFQGGYDDLEKTSDEKPKTETPVKKNKTELPPDQKSFFDRFYQAYPKHVAKEDAVRAWKKITPPPTEDFVNTLIARIDILRTTDGWLKNNGEFIPNPATWLNGKRWDDEIKTGTSSSGNQQKKEPIPPSRRIVVAGDPEIYANRDQELWDRMTD